MIRVITLPLRDISRYLHLMSCIVSKGFLSRIHVPATNIDILLLELLLDIPTFQHIQERRYMSTGRIVSRQCREYVES